MVCVFKRLEHRELMFSPLFSPPLSSAVKVMERLDVCTRWKFGGEVARPPPPSPARREGQKQFLRVCRFSDIKLLWHNKQNGGKDDCVQSPIHPGLAWPHDKSRLTGDKPRERESGGETETEGGGGAGKWDWDKERRDEGRKNKSHNS